MKNESGKPLLKVGVIGTILAAICCTTPILVIALGMMGLGAMTGYLDYVLLPLLGLFILLALYGFLQGRKKDGECCTIPKNH